MSTVPSTPRLEPQGTAALGISAEVASAMAIQGTLALLGTEVSGLSDFEAQRRRSIVGPNAVRTYRAHWGKVLLSQLRSPLLILLTVAAVASYFLGQGTDAVIIVVILALSVGLGFLNEYRAEVSAEAPHSRIKHKVTVWRDGRPVGLDVVELVPGDVIDLQLGEAVPADVRLVSVAGPRMR